MSDMFARGLSCKEVAKVDDNRYSTESIPPVSVVVLMNIVGPTAPAHRSEVQHVVESGGHHTDFFDDQHHDFILQTSQRRLLVARPHFWVN